MKRVVIDKENLRSVTTADQVLTLCPMMFICELLPFAFDVLSNAGYVLQGWRHGSIFYVGGFIFEISSPWCQVSQHFKSLVDGRLRIFLNLSHWCPEKLHQWNPGDDMIGFFLKMAKPISKRYLGKNVKWKENPLVTTLVPCLFQSYSIGSNPRPWVSRYCMYQTSRNRLLSKSQQHFES